MIKDRNVETAIRRDAIGDALAAPSLPREAEVVVVGGGCMGASIAFHLARRDVDVVLLEKDHVASGATGHSGALVRQHYESRIGIRLARESLAFFQRFEKETGFPCDFRPTGFLTGTKLRGGKSLACERVVVAAGNWTPQLVAKAGPRLPLRFVRGDVAILRRPVDFGPPPKIHFDFYGNTYSRPEGDKDTLCGYMDTDPRKTARNHELGETLPSATVRDLRGRLAKRFPRMTEAQPRGGWSGAYDVTPDSYPILDRFGPDGLFVAVGFRGHGFKLSPEVGRLLAEFVATGRRPEALEALQASRFEEGRPVRPDAPFPRRGRRLP